MSVEFVSDLEHLLTQRTFNRIEVLDVVGLPVHLELVLRENHPATPLTGQIVDIVLLMIL